MAKPSGETPDKSQLEDLLDRCGGYTQNNYTPATWEIFAESLAAAQEVYDDPDATQQQIDTAVDDLNAGMLQLALKADKSALSAALEAAGQIDPSGYTKESYAALQSVVNRANELMADENATQAQVDAIVQSITTAINGLTATGGQNQTPTPGGSSPQTGDVPLAVSVAAIMAAGAAVLLVRKKRKA